MTSDGVKAFHLASGRYRTDLSDARKARNRFTVPPLAGNVRFQTITDMVYHWR